MTNIRTILDNNGIDENILNHSSKMDINLIELFKNKVLNNLSDTASNIAPKNVDVCNTLAKKPSILSVDTNINTPIPKAKYPKLKYIGIKSIEPITLKKVILLTSINLLLTFITYLISL